MRPKVRWFWRRFLWHGRVLCAGLCLARPRGGFHGVLGRSGFVLEQGEFFGVAEPDDGAAAGAHAGGGFDGAFLEGPELGFLGGEVIEAGAADAAFDEFVMTADGADLASFVEVFGAVKDLHDGIEIFLPKAGGIADFAKGDFAFAHPAVKGGFADVEVIGGFGDRKPILFGGDAGRFHGNRGIGIGYRMQVFACYNPAIDSKRQSMITR